MYAHRSPHDSLFDAYARRHVASSIHRFSSGVPCVFLVTLGVLTGSGYSCGPGVGALPGKKHQTKRGAVLWPHLVRRSHDLCQHLTGGKLRHLEVSLSLQRIQGLGKGLALSGQGPSSPLHKSRGGWGAHS